MIENHSNWAGNYTYQAVRVHYPENIEEVQEVVRQARKLRVLGSRHSFNDIADSPEDQVSLARFDAAPVFDHAGRICLVLTALGHAGHFDTRWNGPVANALRAASGELSKQLGAPKE